MRGVARFVRQLLWPFEPHVDGRIGPAWLSASINCIAIDKVMQDRSTKQVGSFSQASDFRLGQVR